MDLVRVIDSYFVWSFNSSSTEEWSNIVYINCEWWLWCVVYWLLLNRSTVSKFQLFKHSINCEWWLCCVLYQLLLNGLTVSKLQLFKHTRLCSIFVEEVGSIYVVLMCLCSSQNRILDFAFVSVHWITNFN